MAMHHRTDEAEIRKSVDKWAEAVRGKDLEHVMRIYAPELVSFDLDPPLRYVGSEAKRRRWLNVFAMYRRLVDYEVRDLTITLADDVAFAHSLNRISGTLKDGARADFWLRWTTCFRKIDGKWLIAHEHLSLPVDPESGRAAMNLEP